MFTKREYLDNDLNKLLDNPKFYQYYEELINTNKTTNLTRIIDLDSVYYKHFYDSIILTKHLSTENKTLLDVGAGAGFPSIPIKIIDNTIEITIIDSLNKRIKFLATLIDKLLLNKVNLIHGRAEELSKINKFDKVTSRAVARLNILVELTLPFVRVGGYFVAYKSLNYEEELLEAKNGIKTLGGSVEKIVKYDISKDEKRTLIFIKKIKETNDKYPRVYGKIKKSPL
ncbi:16S rRNA (guanine(527)-N(7))-methyltransferase RsmG [Candidatus Izemoplasma sp. B36]|uniref:16S rRNA (guanine(527)-N(7))-methyltransferase RsmG n=1 Tax=Candidatus Izemoplasma sp. B36 TaxID=3242468 RepID=UPI003555F330